MLLYTLSESNPSYGLMSKLTFMALGACSEMRAVRPFIPMIVVNGERQSVSASEASLTREMNPRRATRA